MTFEIKYIDVPEQKFIIKKRLSHVLWETIVPTGKKVVTQHAYVWLLDTNEFDVEGSVGGEALYRRYYILAYVLLRKERGTKT